MFASVFSGGWPEQWRKRAAESHATASTRLGRRLAEGGWALRGLRARPCRARCWRVAAVEPESWAAGAVGGCGVGAPVGRRGREAAWPGACHRGRRAVSLSLSVT